MKGNLARDMASYLARDLSGEFDKRLGANFRPDGSTGEANLKGKFKIL
ncbi:MAG: hypothetical protein MUO68_13355 [Desulfobacteraceae bacterium]|nr:hypothetical protein [Desulfobacteraceae bacterium]